MSFKSAINGTLVYELNSFHNSGRKLNWMSTESNSMVSFNVYLKGKFGRLLGKAIQQRILYNEYDSSQI